VNRKGREIGNPTRGTGLRKPLLRSTSKPEGGSKREGADPPACVRGKKHWCGGETNHGKRAKCTREVTAKAKEPVESKEPGGKRGVCRLRGRAGGGGPTHAKLECEREKEEKQWEMP